MLFNAVLVYIEGTYIKFSQPLEYGSDFKTFIIDGNSLTPKTIRYCIRISMKEFLNEEYLYKRFEYLPFQLDKRSIIEALNNFRMGK